MTPDARTSNELTHRDLMSWGNNLDGEMPNSLGATLVLYAKAWASECERLTRESEENDDNARHNYEEMLRLRAVLEEIVRAGYTGAEYIARKALSGRLPPKRAYYETHDPPHCPTCDCGATNGEPS